MLSIGSWPDGQVTSVLRVHINWIINDSFTTRATTQKPRFFHSLPHTRQGAPSYSSDILKVIVKESSAELNDHVVEASKMKDKFPLNIDGYHNVRISETVWLQWQIKFTGLNYAQTEFTHLYDSFFLWLIQSRLANQRSITKLLHGGSLIGSNLHNGGALRRRGLNCVSFLSAEPIRSLYGFETCARLWFYLFHYSFIGLLRPRTTKLSFCDNHEGEGREHFLSFSTTLTARIQFVFWNEKSVSSAGVDLWKWHSYTKRRHTWAESHVFADTYILHRQLATPRLDVYLNEIASNDKMTAIDKNRIFLLHFSYFICGPCIGYITLHCLYKHWFCYLLPSLDLLPFFPFTLYRKSLNKKIKE